MERSGSFTLPPNSDPKIRELFDYWLAIHPEAGLPGRQHLDPMDIPRLLPNIWMLDVKQDPLCFRFRLVGTEIVRFTGRDATGLCLAEVYPDYKATEAYRVHCACARSGEPAYRRSGVLSNPGRRHIEAERLYLPLAENGERVDILLIMTLYTGEPPPRQ
ncbi:PAS domain-containing protein [Pelagibius sp. CAU 1746]|uniref:PAS domain-containing protein n=1 Tax=Pelagibius sp. CAU 1746 TaxID=3140370 RepID=UPI00325ACF72